MIDIPDFVLDSYKRYKLQTQKVVTWLGQTGTCSRSNPQPQPETQPSTKNSKKTPAETTETIPVQDFVPLAQSIVDTDPAITIPRNILHSLRSVIGKRKKCAEFYAQIEGDTTHQRENEKHAYFVGVLEKVFDILIAKAASQSSKSATSEATVAAFANSFSSLTIEDTFSDNDEANVPSDPAQARHAPKAQYEIEYSRREWLFEVYCLYTDFNQVREYIQDMWLDYKAHKIDLMNVSIVTDTAFDLLERAEMEFRKSVAPREFGFDYHATAWPMFDCLELYPNGLEDVGMNFVPIKINKSVKFAGASLDLKKSSAPESVQEDFRLLIEMIPWQEFICGYKQVNPVQDKLCKGIYEAIKDSIEEDRINFDNIDLDDIDIEDVDSDIDSDNIDFNIDSLRIGSKPRKPPPIWLVYATQIFVDIHHILQDDCKRAFEHLRNVSIRALTNARAFVEYTGADFNDAFAHGKRTPQEVIQYIGNWVMEDIISSSRNKYADCLELESTSHTPPHYYYENHPLLCGLMVANITLSMQDIGIQLSDHWGCITAMAHLYNAAQNSHYLEHSWPDMEALIRIHGEANFFVGNRPVGAENYFIGYQLAKGVSAQTFTSASPYRGAIRNGKILKPGQASSTASIFFNRYACEHGEPRLQITLHDVERLLTGLAKDEEERDQDSKEPNTPRRSNSDRRKVAKSFKASRKLSPIELLKMLSRNLASEHTELNFDYVGMHLRCINMLRAIHDANLPQLQEEFPQYAMTPSGMPDKELTKIASWVLSGLFTDMLAGFERESVLMAVASAVLRHKIKTEGRIELDSVKEIDLMGRALIRTVYKGELEEILDPICEKKKKKRRRPKNKKKKNKKPGEEYGTAD
ncbi:uncharacterized protein PAC_13275 [Phialocephala subalpina]|uniref:DUF6604 domain-containing protein n=1 Tax=Phialocephala subalpina TaxID=576137 RepID=A0A1L7XEE0_9HELO|nr:uncharacterized protein PAC_13275 [Phialocephala subalpina]